MRVDVRTRLEKKSKDTAEVKKSIGKKTKKRRRVGSTHEKENVNPKRKFSAEDKAARAQEMLDEYGLCPISMQPMRRAVLPASGQAFDEISIVRYCKSGKKTCPVSGTPLDFKKKKDKIPVFTIDYSLRKFISTQAAYANVFVPSTDKDSLMREVHDSFKPEAAKALVDDCYLGYISLEDLSELLHNLSSGTEEKKVAQHRETCKAIVAECLASREPQLCNIAIDYLESEEGYWTDKVVLQEALAVGQDPDCRGEVLNVLESKVEEGDYTPTEIKTMLAFESENVPVQQFQCFVAETFLGHCARSIGRSPDKTLIPVINQALRVREDLDGVGGSNGDSIDEIWAQALQGLKQNGSTLDEACLERLFWRDNCMVLQNLAQNHQELLMWHLKQHEGALGLCLQTIAQCPFPAPGIADEMYSSDEDDYYSENEEEGFGQGYNSGFASLGLAGNAGRVTTGSRSRTR